MKLITHCGNCDQNLAPVIGATGRTELICLWCEAVASRRAEVAIWAQSPQLGPTAFEALERADAAIPGDKPICHAWVPRNPQRGEVDVDEGIR